MIERLVEFSHGNISDLNKEFDRVYDELNKKDGKIELRPNEQIISYGNDLTFIEELGGVSDVDGNAFAIKTNPSGSTQVIHGLNRVPTGIIVYNKSGFCDWYISYRDETDMEIYRSTNARIEFIVF